MASSSELCESVGRTTPFPTESFAAEWLIGDTGDEGLDLARLSAFRAPLRPAGTTARRRVRRRCTIPALRSVTGVVSRRELWPGSDGLPYVDEGLVVSVRA